MKIKENELLFAKVEKNAIIPTKREEDAGYDVYTCETDTIVIPPCSVRLIDTGIAIGCNKTYFPKFFDKGGMGSKGIIVGAGVGDSGYRNKYFIPLINTNKDKWLIITVQTEEEVKNSTCFNITKNEFNNDFKIATNNWCKGELQKDSNAFLDKKSCIIKYINKAFAQFVILPVPQLDTKEISYEELLKYKSKRGLGNLGSSGK